MIPSRNLRTPCLLLRFRSRDQNLGKNCDAVTIIGEEVSGGNKDRGLGERCLPVDPMHVWLAMMKERESEFPSYWPRLPSANRTVSRSDGKRPPARRVVIGRTGLFFTGQLQFPCFPSLLRHRSGNSLPSETAAAAATAAFFLPVFYAAEAAATG